MHTYLIALVSIICVWSVEASALDEPRSSITILVDLSETWHNEKSRQNNRKVLEAAAQAAVELGKFYRAPTHMRILPIGDASLLREPICDAIFDPKLIAAKNAKDRTFTQEKALLKYLGTDCVQVILSRPKEKFTDISGAIDTASRLAAAEVGSDRALIILSDMLEERPKGQTSPPLKLEGFRSLILYRVLPEDRTNSLKLDGRLKEWETRLAGAGAKVEILPDQGIAPAHIVRKLRN